MTTKIFDYILNMFIVILVIVIVFLIFSPAETFCNCSGLQSIPQCVNPKLYPKDEKDKKDDKDEDNNDDKNSSQYPPPTGPEYIKKLYAENKLTEFTIPPKAGPMAISPMPYDQFQDGLY